MKVRLFVLLILLFCTISFASNNLFVARNPVLFVEDAVWGRCGIMEFPKIIKLVDQSPFEERVKILERCIACVTNQSLCAELSNSRKIDSIDDLSIVGGRAVYFIRNITGDYDIPALKKELSLSAVKLIQTDACEAIDVWRSESEFPSFAEIEGWPVSNRLFLARSEWVKPLFFRKLAMDENDDVRWAVVTNKWAASALGTYRCFTYDKNETMRTLAKEMSVRVFVPSFLMRHAQLYPNVFDLETRFGSCWKNIMLTTNNITAVFVTNTPPVVAQP